MRTFYDTADAWSPSVDPAMDYEPAPPIRLTGDVVVATDGSELAGNAARVALAIARRYGRPVQAVRALDTRGVALPPPLDVAIGLGDALVGPEVHEAQRDEVRASLAAALETPIDWPVRIGIGPPQDVIVREAREADAGIVVIGLRRHGVLGRAFQDEVALHVMRHATCPVLGVVPSLAGLPRHVVAAVDFSRTSRAAARVARDLVAPGGTLTLAYVPVTPPFEDDDGERYIHALGVEAAFARLRRDLGRGSEIVIEARVFDVTSRRPIGEQLLEYADHTGADLLALGSRRYGPLERWLLGSVATDVARDGRVSVLIVPPSPDLEPGR